MKVTAQLEIKPVTLCNNLTPLSPTGCMNLQSVLDRNQLQPLCDIADAVASGSTKSKRHETGHNLMWMPKSMPFDLS